MTAELPAPLVPASLDLRVFPRMPLDVARLRDAETAVVTKGDEFRCAVLLWCVSWHQVPASSLPDDDRLLADFAGFGRVVKEWKKVKAGALRGFVLCSDGRLYHRVVAEVAIDSWGALLKQRWTTACNRIKKQQQRAKLAVSLPTFALWISENCPEASQYVSRWTKGASPEDTAAQEQGQPPPVPGETASNRSEGILPTTHRGDGSDTVAGSSSGNPHPSGPEARESKPRAHGSWRRDANAAMRKMTELGLPSYGLSHDQCIARIEEHLRREQRAA